MENLHIDICSALLFINEMQIKIIRRCRTPASLAKMVTKLLAVVSLGERSDQLICSCWGFKSSVTQGKKKKNYTHMHSAHNPEIQPWVIPTEK